MIQIYIYNRYMCRLIIKINLMKVLDYENEIIMNS